MVGKLVLKGYTHKSKCDVNRCTNRAEFSVGVDGESLYFNHNYCSEHLKDMALVVIEKFNNPVEDKDFIDKLPQKTVQSMAVNDTDTVIQELKAELDSKNTTIEYLNEKITDLENVAKSDKPVQSKPIATSKPSGRPKGRR